MKRYLTAIYLFLSFAACTEHSGQELLPEVTHLHKPWTRWWWMGSAVNEPEAGKLLKLYSEAGFGGVEITPIYGARGYEEQYLSYLSEEWMKVLLFTSEKAGEYGMGTDMNLGTGWPFGGPHVSPEFSATRLVTERFELKEGSKNPLKIEVSNIRLRNTVKGLQALTGYGPNGQVADLTSYVKADGTLGWEPVDGDWELYAAFTARTMQMVKRAAPGGDGLTFDHFSESALNRYLDRFNKAFGNTNPGIRAFFNDSYEVYGTNWTDNFFGEFEKRRGYDLKYHLRELTGNSPDEELRHRVHTDFRETLSDLLLENFTRPWTTWAHRYQAQTRNQAHGSPGNLIDLYAAVDIPECETFGSSFFPIPNLRRDSADIRNVDPDPVMLKFATSAANITGKKLISSETFTWLGEHFKTSLAQCKPEVEQVFLSGVNHVFYHGTTYSPAEAGWPGWLFYASVNFNPSNTFWSHLPALNNYVARCQSILQAGEPDNEILIYWPLHDYWMTTNHENIMLTIHDIDKWLHPTEFYQLTEELISEGYCVDFISDRLIETMSTRNGRLVAPSGKEYKAVVFPKITYMPEKTFAKAIHLAESGANVLFGNVPQDIPGAWNITERRQDMLEIYEQAATGHPGITVNDNISKALRKKNILPESLMENGLKFLRRKTGDGTWYFLVNHTSGNIDQFLEFNSKGKHAYLFDAKSGMTGIPQTRKIKGKMEVRVQLKSGESQFVFVGTKKDVAPEWEYLRENPERIALSNPWNIEFGEGGPVIPKGLNTDTLRLWTDLPHDETASFSGTAVYSTTFTTEGIKAGKYMLNLGTVYESAKVKLNGVDAGYCWSHPFIIDVTRYVQSGQNLLEVEVANLAANRIRWMDQQGIVWRNYHEINFVNIDYKPFDASGWQVMPSGLAGPVILEIHK
jgi:hypothetical protein